jgi:chromate transport protein ChrA
MPFAVILMQFSPMPFAVDAIFVDVLVGVVHVIVLVIVFHVVILMSSSSCRRPLISVAVAIVMLMVRGKSIQQMCGIRCGGAVTADMGSEDEVH